MNGSSGNDSRSRLGAALAGIAAAWPLERKLLVCARPAHGRELLRSLAQDGIVWAGFDIMTPQQLAHAVVAPDIALEGLRLTDEFDELALLDDAMDDVLGGTGEGLGSLAEGVGLRQAIVHAVRALRLAGVDAPALERARFRDEQKRGQIARILAVYERALQAGDRPLIDGAGVLRRAVSALAMGSASIPYDRVWLLPGQSLRGLAGQMVEVLRERGATVLPADPVHGMQHPAHILDGSADDDNGTLLSWLQTPGAAPDDVTVTDIGMFAASSMTSELREVLRRIVAAGLRWDEVEIIATDAVAYGVALDGLARRLDIPVSYATGLPVSRTRPGRAVAGYLEWIQSDFPAHALREMLERGDIVPPADAGVSAMAAARLLRRLRIGRGRDQYARAIARRERILAMPQAADDERSPGEFAEERALERRELAALRAVVQPLLASTPALGQSAGMPTVSPSDLANGLIALLERVPADHSVDRTARDRLLERVRRVHATLHRRTSLASAIAVVVSKLDDRVPAPEEPGSAPWTASGGYLHLSDLDHGGFCGRRVTFIVGLDAARFPGGRFNDALLVDDDRRRIIGGTGAAALPLSAERIEERRWLFGALAARLRGSVTFSYAAWDAVEGRAVAPASEMLQVYRLLARNAAADYDELHAALTPAASPIPRGAGRLDGDDVWFGELANDGRLRAGLRVVQDVYPHLRRGVEGYRERQAPVPSARHGVIAARPELDPRRDPARVVSATQLQALGTCPHRYLLRYVLGVRAPDDPELSSEEWLSALERGALMHRVYERSLSAARDDGIALSSDAFEQRVLDILDEETEARRELLPPPGAGIFRMECEQLREDARAFVAMVREDGDRYIALERKFGRDGADAVVVALPDGSSLNVAGAIDRVDRLPDGRLVVIDYKTGRRTRFGARNGAYDGGRRLQHVLYGAVARILFAAEVARAEYHFPTRASENYRATFEQTDLAGGLPVITELLDMVAAGAFIPTNDPEDCTYCDFAAVCRVKPGSWGRCHSPLAEWSRNVDSELLDLLRRLRR